MFSTLLSAGAQPTARIRSHIDDSRTFVLRNNTRQVVARGIAQDGGSVPHSQLMPRMFLQFAMTAAQKADLDQLLVDQQNRRSPQYHHFLTPEQYASRFGLADDDLQKVTRWLEDRGFNDVQVARSHNWVSFSGTAGHAESAFGVSIHRYTAAGETHIANTGDPHLPQAFQGIVQNVRGLHDFSMRPHLKQVARPQYSFGSNSPQFLVPDDWETIYDVKPLYAAGMDGSGVTIAVLGQSDVQLSDIAAFRAAVNLPPNAPTVVVPPGDTDPGFASSGDEAESDLDLEWAGAIARNATILFVTASPTTGNGVFDSLTYVIDNNVAPIVTLSYGDCEADEGVTAIQSMDDLLAQANAQGMTIVASSGDAGATACDQGITETAATHGLAVNFPASSSHVTGIGGTEFNSFDSDYWGPTNNSNGGTALSYIPERAWNDGQQQATGGGASTVFTKPAWQTGVNVPADGARDIPDVAFTASLQYGPLLFCPHNWCTNGFLNTSSEAALTGGTSAGAPTFAGVLALVLEANGSGNRLGNINPNLYSLAQISSNIFHDVTEGNNFQMCQSGNPICDSQPPGYGAGVGYDLTTGLGSIDAYNFAEQWSGDIQLSASPTQLTISPGSSASASVGVAPFHNFSGNVTLACSVSDGLIDVTCSVSPADVDTSGNVTVTISAASTARTHRPPPIRLLPPNGWPRLALPLFFAASLLMLGMIGCRLRWAPRQMSSACLAGGLLLAGISISCGGSGSTPSTSSGAGAGTGTGTGTGTPPVSPLTLSCDFPSTATVGVQYFGQCSAQGGAGTLTYSVSSGTLPDGLTLNGSEGTITGTPTTTGTASFTIEVSDSETPAATATQAFTGFHVAPAPLVLSCNVPSPFLVNAAYNGGCTASGGIGPMTYSVSSGALPAGISLDPNSGSLTGSAQASDVNTAMYNFTIAAADSETPPQTAKQSFSDTVTTAAPLRLICSLSEAAFQALYRSNYCTGLFGFPPYTYSIVQGSLPAGITIDPKTGFFSGTPTVQGTSCFTVQVADSQVPADVVTQAASIKVGSRLTETGYVTITATSGEL